MYQFVSEGRKNEGIKNKKNSKINQNYLLWFFHFNPKPEHHEKRFFTSILDIQYKKNNFWFRNERVKRRKALLIIPFIKFTVKKNNEPDQEFEILCGSIHKFSYHLADVQNENTKNISPHMKKIKVNCQR